MGTKAQSLAHTKWLCKYHIVFTPKYRRKIIFAQLRDSIKEILQSLCKYKGVEILEGHLMPDHIHMLVSIPPKISVSSFMGYLKGKSSLMIFDKHANLKYKFGNRKLGAEGLCQHRRAERGNDQKIYPAARKTRHYARQVEYAGVSRPL